MVPAGDGVRRRCGRFTVGRMLGQDGFGITYKGARPRLPAGGGGQEAVPEFALRIAQSNLPADT